MSVTATDNFPAVEFQPVLGNRDFLLRIKRYPDDGSYNGGQTWVQLDETVCTNGHYWQKFIFSHQVEPGHDLQVLRDAFKQVRDRMKADVRSWSQYRYWASLEKGGKRAYYSKHANYWRGRITESATMWLLCRQLWKELVKL